MCDRSLQTTCRPTSGGGVRFSALRRRRRLAASAPVDLEEASMPPASIAVAVDEHLLWIVRLPEVLAGATRAASAEQLERLGAEFDASRFTAYEAMRADIAVGAITRAVIEFLREPPELPFIGEPFGGEGGTD
jgi:hypothetical protein